EIMRDVVSNFLQAPHQGLDPFKHHIQVFGQTIQFIASARDWQSPPQIATHDRARRLCHCIDAAQNTAGDEEATSETQDDDDRNRPPSGGKYDIVEALA